MRDAMMLDELAAALGMEAEEVVALVGETCAPEICEVLELRRERTRRFGSAEQDEDGLPGFTGDGLGGGDDLLRCWRDAALVPAHERPEPVAIGEVNGMLDIGGDWRNGFIP